MPYYRSNPTGYYDSDVSPTNTSSTDTRYPSHRSPSPSSKDGSRTGRYESGPTSAPRGGSSNQYYDRPGRMFDYNEDMTRNSGSRNKYGDGFDSGYERPSSRYDSSDRGAGGNVYGSPFSEPFPRRNALTGPGDPRAPGQQRHGSEEHLSGHRAGVSRHSAAEPMRRGLNGVDRMHATLQRDARYLQDRSRNYDDQAYSERRGGPYDTRENSGNDRLQRYY